MATNSKIEWTTHTWNPWRGCHKVSQGCKNCYMFREQTRYGRNPNTVVKAAPGTFNAPLKWGEPAKVFTCSWSDWFIEEADQWRDEAWQIIEQTPHLTYQILTKRPERIEACLPERWLWSNIPKNIWFGISAENQDALQERWPIVQGFAHTWNPAVIFLSLEPLLGPIELNDCLLEIDLWDEDHMWWTRPVDWVIVGGESGPGARPMHPQWARDIRDQCQQAGVAFFFKQWGEWVPIYGDELDEYGCYSGKEETQLIWGRKECGYYCDEVVGHVDHNSWPMKRVGKKAAGRLLDGQEWSQFPVVESTF